MAGRISRECTLQDLPELLASFGEAPALISFKGEVSETLTFGELSRRALEIAEGVRCRGIGLGEPVGIVASNGPPWVTACLGILAAGAAVAPLDVQQSESDRARLIEIIGCRFAFSDRKILSDGSFGGSPSEEGLNLYPLSPQSSGEQAADVPGALLARPIDLALIVHTSGTTGTRKAVPLSHSNIMANLIALDEAGVAGPRDRALTSLPLHHIYPLLVGLLLPLSIGASVVLQGNTSGPEFTRVMRLGRVTVLIGVPGLYQSLLAAILAQADARLGVTALAFHHLLDFSVYLARHGHCRFGRLAFKAIRRNVAPSLYRLVSAGALLEEETELKLLGLGYEVLTGYGLSETASVVTFNLPGHSRPGSAGEPLPQVELRITKPEAGGAGGIEVRGPNVFTGYRNDPDKTKAAFSADGWFRTGDLGWVDADGHLHTAGRASETIVLPGNKALIPETLEAQYAANTAIAEIGIMAEGRKLVGLIVPSPLVCPGDSLEAAKASVRLALTSCANLLPNHLRLSGFALTQQPLPRTQMGNLRRHLLPALYREARRKADTLAARHKLPEADRIFLAEPAARRVWLWLQARFPGQRLSLQMNPGLDLGLDSLGWVGLATELEQALDIAFDDGVLSRTVTLRDLVALASTAGIQPMPAEAVLPSEPGMMVRASWHAANAINRLIMKTFFRLKVEGVEYLPERAPYLVCPNHTSYLDPLALAAALPWPVLRQAYWAAATDILFGSFWRRALSTRARIFSVDPSLGIRRALALSAAALRTSHILVWFAEGWRSRDGTLQPFLPGIGTLVLGTPVPVVPVYIKGTFKAWPVHHRLPHVHALTIRFGRPLDPKQWAGFAGKEDAEERIALLVRERVAALGNK
ncbi:MAG: AMP-binding protein [Rhodomicrobium sp.]